MKIKTSVLLTSLLFLINCIPQYNNSSEENSYSSHTKDRMDLALTYFEKQIIKRLPSNQKIKIAVIEFSDLQDNVTNLGKYLSEELISRLFYKDMLEVVERSLLKKVIDEYKLSLSGIADPSSAKKLGHILGIDAICSGTITDLGSSLKNSTSYCYQDW